MKKLSQLLESINEVDSLLEIDFKNKKAFQKYNAKHKMRPTTKVNIAGKDTTVGDETGKKSKGDETGKKSKGKKDAPVNPDVKIDRDDFEGAFDRAMDGQNYQDAEEFQDIISNMENQGKFDNLSKDEKLKLEDSMWDLEVGGAELDDDRAIAIRDFFFDLQQKHNLFGKDGDTAPQKSKKKNVSLDFHNANEEEIKKFAKDNNLEVSNITTNPNGGLEAEFVGGEDNLRKAMTSDFYGMDDKDVDDYMKEFGDDVDDSDAKGETSNFNGIDYKEMEGKEPGVWDRQAVNNLSASNPEIVKQLGLTGDNEKDSPILKKLDLKTISKIIDKYGDDYDKERHQDRLKDDHGIASKDAKKMDKDMDKAAGDANEKMAKDEFTNSIDGDAMSAGEIFDKNKKHIPKELRDEAQEAIFAIMDAEMGMISDEESDWAKDFLNKEISQYIKESKNSDLMQLSKITTRYTNHINEEIATKADYEMDLHFDHLEDGDLKGEKKEAQDILRVAKSHRLKAKLSRGMGGRGYSLDIKDSDPHNILKFLIDRKAKIFPPSEKKYAAGLIAQWNDDDFEYTSKGKFEMV